MSNLVENPEDRFSHDTAHFICFLAAPPEFDFYFYQRIYVLGTSQVGIPRETSNIHTVRMQGDYTSLTDSELAQLEQMVIQDISKKFPDVIITDSSTSAGKKDTWTGGFKCFYVPPTEGGGGHIVFGADPICVGVNVHVASFLCVIF